MPTAKRTANKILVSSMRALSIPPRVQDKRYGTWRNCPAGGGPRADLELSAARRDQTVTQTQPAPKSSAKTYTLQGTLLEACSCRTLCRCWIGEDPDGGACDSFLAYNIEKGEIN